MRLEKRRPSGREKDAESLELLENLRERLFLANQTVARQSAFNLSWLQEDGMEILAEALFAEGASRRTRGAAAYGLRKMRGRMRVPARQVLERGARHSFRGISQVCKNALSVLDGTHVPHKRYPRRRGRPRIEVRDLPPRGNRRVNHNRRVTPRFHR